LQCLQDPSEINGDNLNNARHEACRYIRNKKREYLKDKINELATNSKNKNIRDLYRGINRLKLLLQSLEKYKSPGSDEIPAELIQAEGEILLSAIHKLINSA
jgi:hypothetical protein